MSTGKDNVGPINLPDTLEDAERFQRLFVQPMVEAVRAEVKPLIQKVAEHDAEIADLKGSQKKALAGWGVYATLAAALIGVGLDWVKGWFSGGGR